MTAQEKLTAKISSMETEALLEISLRFAVSTNSEEIIVATYTERELEARLPEAEFLAHMGVIDALFELAA